MDLCRGSIVVEPALSARQRWTLRGSLSVLCDDEEGKLYVSHDTDAAAGMRGVLAAISLRMDDAGTERAMIDAIVALVTEGRWAVEDIVNNPSPATFGLVQCLAASVLFARDLGARCGFYINSAPRGRIEIRARQGAALAFQLQGEDWGAPYVVVLRL